MKLRLIIWASLLALPFSNLAVAHDNHGDEDTSGHHFAPKTKAPSTAPSAVYSGNTPIDRSNGIFFNSGTFGARNPDYETWASGSTWAVSLSERPYNFEQKDRFIATLDERIKFYEASLENYARVTDTVSTPEGKAHAEKSAADLNPRISKARDAWSKAKSSGQSEWGTAQNDAKKSFLELQSFYYGMHKNVR